MLSEAWRYLLATTISFLMSPLLSLFLREVVGVSIKMAVAIALAFVFVTNFFIIRLFVFRKTGSPSMQFTRFAATSAVFRICEFGLFLLLLEQVGLHYIAALVGSLIISFLGKFFVQRNYVFR